MPRRRSSPSRRRSTSRGWCRLTSAVSSRASSTASRTSTSTCSEGRAAPRRPAPLARTLSTTNADRTASFNPFHNDLFISFRIRCSFAFLFLSHYKVGQSDPYVTIP